MTSDSQAAKAKLERRLHRQEAVLGRLLSYHRQRSWCQLNQTKDPAAREVIVLALGKKEMLVRKLIAQKQHRLKVAYLEKYIWPNFYLNRPIVNEGH